MKNKHHKVKDPRTGRAIRGLWVRNGKFYARFRLEGAKNASWIPIQDADTVAAARDKMQGLKSKRDEGTLQLDKQRGVITLQSAGEQYLASLKTLGNKSMATQELHRFSLDRWNAFNGAIPVNKIDSAFIHRFAEWRKPQGVSGRTIDIEVSVLRKTLEWAVTHAHLRDVPNFRWSPLAEPPEEKRLLTEDEIKSVCDAAITDGNRQVADHLRLLAYTGMREQEGCRARWSDVDWNNKQIKVARVVDTSGTGVVALNAPGDKKRTKNKLARVIDFNSKLEAHLKEMFARRDQNSQWLFPSPRPDGRGDVPVQDLRKGRDAAIAAAKIEHFGFHHLRHYFISMCVMSGIDFMTIADWVGHQDRGILICKTYGHLCDAHKKQQAAKVSFSPKIIQLDQAAA